MRGTFLKRLYSRVLLGILLLSASLASAEPAVPKETPLVSGAIPSQHGEPTGYDRETRSRREGDLRRFVNPQEIEAIRRGFDSKTRMTPGGWTGGGGLGVVCFTTAEASQKALDSSRALLPEAREKVDAVLTLDFYESLKRREMLMAPTPDETSESYLNRMLTNLDSATPQFASRLRQALEIARPANWHSQPFLPRLDDTGGLQEERLASDRCQYVQLAVRYAQSNPGHIPRVFLDYDQDLLEKMRGQPLRIGVVNEATLWLHEALYLLGVEMEHENSYAARRLTALLLSERFNREIQAAPANERSFAFLKAIGRLHFDHYMRLFTRELSDAPGTSTADSRVASSSKYSKSTRILSQASLSKNVDEAMWAATGTRNIPDAFAYDRDPVLRETVTRKMVAYLADHLTDEEAFLYAAFVAYIGHQSNWNNEIFVTEGVDDREAMAGFCATSRQTWEQIKKGQLRMRPRFEEILQKTSRYCDPVTAAPK